MSDTKPKKRFHVKTLLILLLVAAGAYAAFWGPSILKPVNPVVVLPGEHTGLSLFGLEITNTMLATLLADVILIVMGFSAWRFSKSGQLVPKGFFTHLKRLLNSCGTRLNLLLEPNGDGGSCRLWLPSFC